MPVWDTYPDDYRKAEITRILDAVRAGECVSLVGLSGAGKSNLVGFLSNRVAARMAERGPALVLVDGNRAQQPTADAMLQLARQTLQAEAEPQAETPTLRAALGARLSTSPGGLCLLFDRYDVLNAAEQMRAAGPLRALRDEWKYQLTYVMVTRRPLAEPNELAELFYAHTLWLGPLSREDACWSAGQYAARRGQAWGAETLERLAALSWGYPALLRACCEAYAAGCELETDALRAHPAVQRRVKEFWSDEPGVEAIRRSGLAGQPLLSTPDASGAELTASEHRLLAYFQAHAGQVCAKDDLMRAVWPDERLVDGLRDDSLAQLIRRLRVKIGAERVQTVTGRGYRYTPG